MNREAVRRLTAAALLPDYVDSIAPGTVTEAERAAAVTRLRAHAVPESVLTPRQLDTLEALIETGTTKGAAHALGISVWAIGYHVRAAIERTGSTSLYDLLARVGPYVIREDEPA